MFRHDVFRLAPPTHSARPPPTETKGAESRCQHHEITEKTTPRHSVARLFYSILSSAADAASVTLIVMTHRADWVTGVTLILSQEPITR